MCWATSASNRATVRARRGDAGCVVRSTFMLLEWRKTEQRAFGGSVLHTLRKEGGNFLIQTKRIDLVNCDAPHEALQVFM
jgi:3-phenylpropionate/cinnamic acid dioxygenase small subunit